MSPVLQINTDVNTELLCLWPAYLPRAHLRVFSRVSRVSAKPNASVFSFITYRPMTSHFCNASREPLVQGNVDTGPWIFLGKYMSVSFPFEANV